MGTARSVKRSDLLNTADAPTRAYEVSSVRKSLELLGCFSQQSPSWQLSDLARKLHIPKSTAHNLLRTLQSFDLVRQDQETRAYRVGPRAMELGLIFARSNEMLSRARPVLRRLAELTKETVKLGILSTDEVLIVAAVESTHQLHTRGDVGTRWPLHSTGMGKAILSALPPEEAADILTRRGLSKFTPHTLATPAQIEKELKRIRTRGFALDMEENELGVRCVAVPVSDPLQTSFAAISISGPGVRISSAIAEEFGRQAIAAARSILCNPHSESL